MDRWSYQAAVSDPDRGYIVVPCRRSTADVVLIIAGAAIT